MEKYNITADNIYNFDEKGFLIGMGSASKHTVTQELLNNSQVLRASQNSSHKSISLLAYMCTDQIFLLLTLLYKGESNNFQSSWVKDLKKNEIAYFAMESNWTSDSLRVQ